MSQLPALFLENLLPIFLAAGAGYFLSRFSKLNPRPLSQVIFYIFSPCLLYTLLTNSRLSNGDILSTMLFASMVILSVGALTWLATVLLRFPRPTQSAVLLSSMFMNSGNFGLPVVLFAFGETGLAFASLFFVTNLIFNYTFGVVIASMGTASIKQSLLNLIKIPAIYAVILSFFSLQTGWQLPLPVDRTVNLLGDASIPAMLVLLGMQLQSVDWRGKILPLAITNFMRLLAAPAIAILIAPLFNLTGAAYQAGVLESAMPTAVLCTVLATEYDAEPKFVTAAVISTTLLSPLVLTPLLAYLGA
ncbi:MAG TPA: AEC family transporter [Anaerolineales bacterium]|nr:AEC family transporter [Anaerolineales bacterium]